MEEANITVCSNEVFHRHFKACLFIILYEHKLLEVIQRRVIPQEVMPQVIPS